MFSKTPTSISERRSQYPLHERLIVYNSESMQRMIDNKSNTPVPVSNPTANAFTVNGVNLLNRNSLDSDTLMHRIIQRRQTHNRVERRRRDRMNNLFNDLSKCLPALKDKPENNRADILQEAINYIKSIQLENNRLKQGEFAAPSSEEDDSTSVTSSYSSSYSTMSSPESSPLFVQLPASSVTSPVMTCLPTLAQDQSCTVTPKPMKHIRTPPQSHFESVLTFK